MACDGCQRAMAALISKLAENVASIAFHVIAAKKRHFHFVRARV